MTTSSPEDTVQSMGPPDAQDASTTAGQGRDLRMFSAFSVFAVLWTRPPLTGISAHDCRPGHWVKGRNALSNTRVTATPETRISAPASSGAADRPAVRL
jgi:hypothetical protein